MQRDVGTAFKTEGFLLLKKAVSPSLLRSVYSRALQIAADLEIVTLQKVAGKQFRVRMTASGGRNYQLDPSYQDRYATQLTATKEYQTLKHLPSIRTAVQSILHHKPRSLEMVFSSNSRICMPGVRTVYPHQDHFYVSSKVQFVGAWVPLAACPRRQGSLAVIPASHRHGLFHHDGPKGIPMKWNDFDWWTHSYQAGDVLLFDRRTIHAPLENQTKTPRFSADFRYY